MRLFRFAIISFLVLAILIFGISLLIPAHVRISRSVVIHGSKDSILAHISDAARWRSWYPGADVAQPLMVNGQMKGIVFDTSIRHLVYVVLKEKQEKENEVEGAFVTPKLNTVDYNWVAGDHSSPDSTRLTWDMSFHLRWYPWEKFASLTLEKTQGPPMEEGLANIKRIVEN